MSYKLDPKQRERIQKLPCDQRYDYFLKKVTDWGELWILINDERQFLKLYSEDDDIEYLPIWPHADFAADYAEKDGEQLQPEKLDLDTFFERWIPGLKGDNLCVNIFPTLDQTVLIMKPSELAEDIEGHFGSDAF